MSNRDGNNLSCLVCASDEAVKWDRKGKGCTAVVLVLILNVFFCLTNRFFFSFLQERNVYFKATTLRLGASE